MTEEKAFSGVERVPNCESRRRESIGQGLAGAIVIVAVVIVALDVAVVVLDVAVVVLDVVVSVVVVAVVVLDVVIVVVVVFVSRGRKISIHI